MSQCEFCSKESKVYYICLDCGKRLCREHRKPEHHECIENVNQDPILTEHLEDSGLDGSKFTNLEEILFTENSLTLDQDTDKIIKSDERNGPQLDELPKKEIKTKHDLFNQEKDNNSNQEKNLISKMNGRINPPLIGLIIISIVVGVLIGNNFIPNQELQNLKIRHDSLMDYYAELLNVTNILQTDYDSLMTQYREVLDEKVTLEGTISEQEEILNYEKTIQLASNQIVTILPSENQTITFEIPFSGFIKMNYTATNEIGVRIGSDSFDIPFYSRPYSTLGSDSTGVISIPVHPDLLISFTNKDPLESVEVRFWVSLTY